jgi:hypothetical protein
MDVRDLAFWHREARKKSIRDRMSAIQAARLAMSKDSAYGDIMSKLQTELAELEYGSENIVKESWNVLKMMRRR